MIQIDFDGYLSTTQIRDIISDHSNSDYIRKYIDNEAYFRGENPTIAKGTLASVRKTTQKGTTYIDTKTGQPVYSTDAPDNRIAVPYGRKLSLTTKNYLFNKPVQYNSQDTTYIDTLRDVFYINDGYRKTNQVGLDLVVHGQSYKLFYIKDVSGSPVPAYAVIPGHQMIPIYDTEIEPQLQAVIRYYKHSRKYTTNEIVWNIEVYYPDKSIGYESNGETAISGEIKQVAETVNPFGAVPVVVYGDDYKLGVFDAVKDLIDGLDMIVSMNLNEVEKFALAYLVLTGQSISNEDAKEIQDKRIIELELNSKIEYLTKSLDGDFNKAVEELLIAQIHKQSGIPDFDSKEFAAESGIALQYKLMGFENLASDIESIFIEGEQKSIDLINSIVERTTTTSIWDRFAFWKDNPSKQVEITMARNIPEDTKNKMEVALDMQTLGMSQESIMSYVPMVEDVDAELERQEENKQSDIELMNSMQTEPQLPEDDDELSE